MSWSKEAEKDGVVIIEWAEKALPLLPEKRINLSFGFPMQILSFQFSSKSISYNYLSMVISCQL